MAGDSLSLPVSVTRLPWVAFKGPGLPSMETLGLHSSVTQGKKPGLFPCSTHPETKGMPGTLLHIQSSSQDIWVPDPRSQEATVPREPSTVTPTPSSLAALGASRAAAYSPPPIASLLSSLEGKITSPPLAEAWLCLSVCPAGTSCWFCNVWHAWVPTLLALALLINCFINNYYG